MSFKTQKLTIFVVGGYGFFGRRLAQRLALQTGLQVHIAGRSLAAAETLVRELQPTAMSELEWAAVDAMHTTFADHLKQINANVVINASGPFQGQDYRIAESCIAAGAHYIDLADGREFVTGIGTLNSAACKAGVLVISGASSVPALSSAAADHLTQGLQSVEMIDVGISPGNRTERGLSTVQGILSYCGKDVPQPVGQPSVGWLNSYRHTYPVPVGSRLHSLCDVPDLALLPGRYAGHPHVRFGAGLELEFLHRGMNLMAWMVRHRLVKNWASHAQWLKRAADLFQTWGTDAGAMHVSVTGTTCEGQSVTRKWQLVATQGDGPYVPTLAASALVRKLTTGNELPVGAMPCIGLLTIEDFSSEMHGLNITTTETHL